MSPSVESTSGGGLEPGSNDGSMNTGMSGPFSRVLLINNNKQSSFNLLDPFLVVAFVREVNSPVVRQLATLCSYYCFFSNA